MTVARSVVHVLIFQLTACFHLMKALWRLTCPPPFFFTAFIKQDGNVQPMGDCFYKVIDSDQFGWLFLNSCSVY